MASGGTGFLSRGGLWRDRESVLPTTLVRLLVALLPVPFGLAECRAQVEALLARGIQPSHLDTHKHVHLLAWTLEAVAQVADEFDVRRLRKPFSVLAVRTAC